MTTGKLNNLAYSAQGLSFNLTLGNQTHAFVLAYDETEFNRSLVKLLSKAYAYGLTVMISTNATRAIDQVQVSAAQMEGNFQKTSQNIQVSVTTDLNNAHSESVLAVDLNNTNLFLGASKRFNSIKDYSCGLAAFNSNDGGLTWKEKVLAQSTWSMFADPAIAWDNAGRCYLIGVALTGFDPDSTVLGMGAYVSSDRGESWQYASMFHQSAGDDKPAVTSDPFAGSPFFGRIYCAWDDGPTTILNYLRFARTHDGGKTWQGVGGAPAGEGLERVQDSFSPAMTVTKDGTLYIFWRNYQEDSRYISPFAENSIKFVKSTDGGETFSGPFVAVSGLIPLSYRIASPTSGFSEPGSFPELPSGHFRVLSIPTGASIGSHLVVSWLDIREGACRIYYRHSPDRGATWEGPEAGQALWGGRAPAKPDLATQCFHVQLAADPTGSEDSLHVGCAYYKFGYKETSPGVFSEKPLIDVMLAVSRDGGASFPFETVMTDMPWDPSIDAPSADGSKTTQFIGEYFGLNASAENHFRALWTDTRTGYQDLFLGSVNFQLID